MSHAVYHFLLALDLAQRDGELRQAAETAFDDYAFLHCDENNGSSLLSLVAKDGRFLRWEEREEAAESGDSWDAARVAALHCVAADLRLFELFPAELFPSELGARTQEEHAKVVRMEALTLADLLLEVHQRVPKRLAELYSLLAPPALRRTPGPADYERASLARLYELLRFSEFPPFSDSVGTPYCYRAWDLTGAEEPTAILQVEIHR